MTTSLPALPFKFLKVGSPIEFTATADRDPNRVLVSWKSWKARSGDNLNYSTATVNAEELIRTGFWEVFPMPTAAAPLPVVSQTMQVGEANTSALGHDSLAALKAGWKETIHGDGGDCPVCSRFGKVYDRTINETMAGALKWLYDQSETAGDPRTWIDCPASMPKEFLRSNQHTVLRWWGLVERKAVEEGEKKKKHSGMWRITLKGKDFVEGLLRVPSRVFTYDGEVVSVGDDWTWFKDCKGGFDYSAVMGSTHIGLGKSLFPANDERVEAA